MVQITEIAKKIKDQNLRIGVAVEGGGLRGVVSLGLLSVIKDLSLESHIEAIAGTSSGAINTAYFLSDKIEDCLNMYKDMASPRFLQPLKWPDAMNLDYLFNQRMEKAYPLNLQKIQEHKAVFFVTATEIVSGESRAFEVRPILKDVDLKTILRASASSPLFSTNRESILGSVYNDGHVQLSIPFGVLLEKNLDLVLCLHTQQRGYRKKESFFGSLHQWMALRKYSRSYKNSFGKSRELYNIHLTEIENNPKIVSLMVEPEDFIVSKMCKNPDDIFRCFESTRRRFLK